MVVFFGWRSHKPASSEDPPPEPRNHEKPNNIFHTAKQDDRHKNDTTTLSCPRDKPCAINVITGVKDCRPDLSYYPVIEGCTPANDCPSYMPFTVDTTGLTSIDECLTNECRCTGQLHLGTNLNSAFNVADGSDRYIITPTNDYSDQTRDRPTIPESLVGLLALKCPYGQLMMYPKFAGLVYLQVEAGSIVLRDSIIPMACVKGTIEGDHPIFDRQRQRVADVDTGPKERPFGELQQTHTVEVFYGDDDDPAQTFTVEAGTLLGDLPEILSNNISDFQPVIVQVRFNFRPELQQGAPFANYLEVRATRLSLRSVRIHSDMFSPLGFIHNDLILTSDKPYITAVDSLS